MSGRLYGYDVNDQYVKVPMPAHRFKGTLMQF